MHNSARKPYLEAAKPKQCPEGEKLIRFTTVHLHFDKSLKENEAEAGLAQNATVPPLTLSNGI